jgi:HEAT repeat protein
MACSSRVVCSILIFIVTITCAVAQYHIPVAEGQPETTKEQLKRHHVALTEQGLIKALGSREAEVRELAAQALSEDGYKDAVPSIEQALLAETVPGNRVNIALSLAKLGDPVGRELLKSTCDNDTEPAHIRTLAAVDMSYLHDESCATAVFDVLKSTSPDDVGAREQALSLLPGLKELKKQNAQRILDAAAKALRDDAPGVRMIASSTLSSLGDPSAIPYLRSALDKEQDEGCRLQLSVDLAKLQSKIDERH